MKKLAIWFKAGHIGTRSFTSAKKWRVRKMGCLETFCKLSWGPVRRSTPYGPQCAAETLEYIRSACKISTLSPPASLSARPSSSLPSRPRFTYILSLYFYDASGGFPPSLPISLYPSISSPCLLAEREEGDYVSLSVLCMT